MSTDDGVGPLPRSANATLLAVVGVTLLALLARVVGLGSRIMHWDEGRVGYWILRYHETGEFYYRPIIHGPFLPIVNDYVFAVLPPTDFSARLVVAVVGGLLPLSAWLFRDRLRDAEVVALALFLAADPLLVYYSRFMRNDVLVAAFSFAALAFFVRGVDARNPWYLAPAGASLGLAFTTKENAILYVLCYLGAAALLFDHRLLRAASDGRSPRSALDGYYRDARRGLCRWSGDLRTALFRLGGHVLGAFAAFLAVVVFFYAPRPDLWGVFSDPSAAPAVFGSATFGAWGEFYDLWAAGGHQSHDYLPYLFDLLETIAYGAGVLVVFAVLGFVVDGYASDGGSRDLVAFAGYWGAASVVGYPVATDIQAPWAAVHVVVPLTIPAAVGAAYVYRTARASLAVEDAVGAGLAAVVLLAAGAGVVGANAAYMDSASVGDKEVLQWAQPGNDLKDTVGTVCAVSRENRGTDVLFYGTRSLHNADEVLFYVENESSTRDPPPGGPDWHSRLPLPWYLEACDAEVMSTPPDADPRAVAADAPPVVFAYEWDRADLEPHLDGYAVYEHDFKLWSERVVVFVDESALDDGARRGNSPGDGRDGRVGDSTGNSTDESTGDSADDSTRDSTADPSGNSTGG
ncbi:flippase activity-associated protein Agl23 [Halegenticoccus soli]|uniref:flippase activity-associated protein Agl23 n=1 Tax=Halegenticoccus soli TaxID=1985678 RepID=UPI000C6EAFD7|nr:flippase activity-associated protein Agl23 [Halegenticoccus soli]